MRSDGFLLLALAGESVGGLAAAAVSSSEILVGQAAYL